MRQPSPQEDEKKNEGQSKLSAEIYFLNIKTTLKLYILIITQFTYL